MKRIFTALTLILFSSLTHATYTCNTGGYINTIGTEVVAMEVPYSSTSPTRYYLATLTCRVTNSATNDGVVERIISTELDMSPNSVASGAGGAINMGVFRGLGTPCHTAYYFIHQNFRGSVSNTLDGQPVSIDFRNSDYPVGQISEAPFNDTFTGAFSVDYMAQNSGWEAPAEIGGAWKFRKNMGNGQVCEVRNYPQNCDMEQGPASTTGNPIDFIARRKVQTEVDYSGTGGLGYRRTYQSPVPASSNAQQLPQATGFAMPGGSLRIQAIGESKLAYRVVYPNGRWYIVASNDQGQLYADSPRRDIPVLNAQGGFTLTSRDGNEKQFDASGQLTEETNANGRTSQYSYSGGLLTAITDPFGRQLAFTYNASGQLTEMRDPGDQLYQYSYDSNDNLINVTYPDGAVKEYLYEDVADPKRLTGILDENGNRFATFAYNADGEAIQTMHADGAERQDIFYTDATHVEIKEYIDVAAGRYALHHYELTELAGIKKVALSQVYECGDSNGCSPQEERWIYDVRGRVQQHTAVNGVITEYTYNDNDQEISRTVNVGSSQAYTVSTEWDPVTFRRTRVTRPDLMTDYEYDSEGNLARLIETDRQSGIQRITNYTYGQYGFLASIDGPRQDVNDITSYTYDAQGNLIEVQNALGHSTQITDHDAHGHPLQIDDGNAVTVMSYDARGRIATRTVDGITTQYEYTPGGQLLRITTADGQVMEYIYDNAQRVIGIRDGAGNRIDYTLDAMGNRIEESVRDPGNQLVRYLTREYDALGRLIRSVGADNQSTEYSYDPSGNQVAKTDPLGGTTLSVFDPFTKVMQNTDAMNGVSQHDYNINDHISSVTDPNGNTTSYSYDGFGNLTRQQSPDSGLTTYTYDEAGNRISQTDALGQTTQYTYDALNRLSTVTYADASGVTYSYDNCTKGIGRLCSITDLVGTINLEYDGTGHVTSRSQSVEGITLTTGYQYNLAGQLTQMTYPSGMVLNITYSQGKVSGLSINGQTLLNSISYQPFGPISGWTWSNGSQSIRGYDLDGRLISHSLAGASLSLSYDVLGNITGITGPTGDRVYGYDALSRLTAANDPTYNLTWSYDANGNRLSQDSDGQVTGYTIDNGSNRLLAVDTAGYQYDANGNLIDDGMHSYQFSVQNRLASVDNGDTAEYRYNALGQRIQKTAMADGTGPDYLALAEAAEQQALAHRDIAAVLQQQADAAAQEAALLSTQANAAQTEADSAQAEATQLSQQADSEAAQAADYTAQAGEFAQTADDYRAQIVANPNWWESILNAIYQFIADVYQWLADDAAAQAQSHQQLADDYSAQAATAQQQADTLQQQADSLSQQAQAKQDEADGFTAQANSEIAQAETLEAQAAEYRRLAEQGGGGSGPVTTRMVYGEQGQLIGEYNADGSVRQETVWLGNLPVATVQNGTVYAIHSDHLGTPRVITDPSNTEVWRWDSDPFGTTAANEDPDVDGNSFTFNLRFPGQYYDSETRKHYNYFRDYDPAIGRYLQPDPLGIEGGIGLYTYALNNPMLWMDSLGLCPAILDTGTYRSGRRYETLPGGRYREYYQYRTRFQGILVGGDDCATSGCDDEKEWVSCVYSAYMEQAERTNLYDLANDSWGGWSSWSDMVTGPSRELTIGYNCKTGEWKKP